MRRWLVILVVLGVVVGCARSPETPRPGMLLWSGNLETGDLSQFRDTPWNTVGGPPPMVIQDPERDGRYAVKVELVGATTEDQGICCGSRNELEPKFRDLVDGDDLWFAFSTYLGEGFPTYYADFQTITQFKQNFDGSPPLELSVQDGEFRVDGGYGHPAGPQEFTESVGHADVGRWVDWVWHVKFSPDPAVGTVEVWRDGALVLPRYSPTTGTMYTNPTDGTAASSVKFGYYRERTIDSTGWIAFDDWRIGTTAQSIGFAAPVGATAAG